MVELELIRDELLAWATSQGAGLICARMEISDSTPRFEVVPSTDDDWRPFASVAALVGARCIMIHAEVLTKAEFESALVAAEHLAGVGPERAAAIRRNRKHIDKIRHMELCAAPTGLTCVVVSHIWSTWNAEVFYDDVDDDSGSEDSDEDDEVPLGDDETALAQRLANDSSFQEHAYDDYRGRVAKRILAHDAPGADRLELIMDEAVAIWNTDVLPVKRKLDRKRATELISNGMSKTNTAIELGMTVPQLNRLLGER